MIPDNYCSKCGDLKRQKIILEKTMGQIIEKMEVYQITETCRQNDCDGIFKPTGMEHLWGYEHKCEKCNEILWLKHHNPYLEYRKVKNE